MGNEKVMGSLGVWKIMWEGYRGEIGTSWDGVIEAITHIEYFKMVSPFFMAIAPESLTNYNEHRRTQ